jgi:hypothetical protein
MAKPLRNQRLCAQARFKASACSAPQRSEQVLATEGIK